MSWSKQARKNLMKQVEKLEKVHRASMVRLATQTEIISPVDSGLFRSNWFGAYGAIDKQTVTVTNRDSTGALRVLVESQPVTGTYFYFTNSLPYAQRLEYGWSEQAPLGMVRVTARNFPRYVREEIQRMK